MTDMTIIQAAMRYGVPSTPDESDAIGRALVEVNARIAAIQEQRLAITRKLDAAKADMIAMEREQTAPLMEAKAYLVGLIEEWNAQEALRLEDERAEREQREADLEAAAIRAMEEGRLDDAGEAMSAIAEFVPEPKAYRPAGTSERTLWKAEVTDMAAFLAWVIEHEEFSLIEVKQAAIDRYASMVKKESDQEGLRFYTVKSIGATRR
jgi:hypothetical protein